MKSATHGIALALVLAVVWYIWSGHTEPFLLAMGLLSCAASIWLAARMGVIDAEGAPAHLGLKPFLLYAPWLVKEIVIANWDVTRRVLSPSLPIRPSVICVPANQKTELGRVIMANSITLTPGTVSIDMQGNRIWVHALSFEGAADDMSGEMGRRVCQLER
jgi:multicomponent Na+:H+ antiporter subunit E